MPPIVTHFMHIVFSVAVAWANFAILPKHQAHPRYARVGHGGNDREPSFTAIVARRRR